MTRSVTVRETPTVDGSANDSDAGGDVDRDTGDVVASKLDLTGMDTAADLHAELAGRVADGARARDRARRTVERRDEAVAGRVDFSAAEAGQLATYGLVVSVQHIAPPVVAELMGSFGGRHDVGEEDGGQDSVGGRGARRTGDEFLDLVEHDVSRVRSPPVVVGARNLDPTGTGDVVGHIATERQSAPAARRACERPAWELGSSREPAERRSPVRP